MFFKDFDFLIRELAGNWDEGPVLVRQGVDLGSQYCQMDFGRDYIPLIKPADAEVYFPKVLFGESPAGIRRHNRAVVKYQDLETFLDIGCTAVVNSCDRYDPFLRKLCLRLKKHLSMPTPVEAQLWMANRSRGISPHFDSTYVLTAQLQGSKEWKIPRHPAVRGAHHGALLMPDGNVYCYGEGTDLHPWSYGEEPRMYGDDEVVRFKLEPGDLLWVPAGYWHWTETSSEASASVNFILSNDFYFTDFLKLLADEDKGYGDAAWRTFPPRIYKEPASEDETMAYLQDRLRAMSRYLDELSEDRQRLLMMHRKVICESSEEKTDLGVGAVHSREFSDATALRLNDQILVTHLEHEGGMVFFSKSYEISFEAPWHLKLGRRMLSEEPFRFDDLGLQDPAEKEEIRNSIGSLLAMGILIRLPR